MFMVFLLSLLSILIEYRILLGPALLLIYCSKYASLLTWNKIESLWLVRSIADKWATRPDVILEPMIKFWFRILNNCDPLLKIIRRSIILLY
jgi:hypothetical protein